MHVPGRHAREAAEIYRANVHVFGSADEVKTFMEGQSIGVVARIVLVDFTMHGDVQTASKSRFMSKQPGEAVAQHETPPTLHRPMSPPHPFALLRKRREALQKSTAEQVKAIPFSPIVGCIITRGGGKNIERLAAGPNTCGSQHNLTPFV